MGATQQISVRESMLRQTDMAADLVLSVPAEGISVTPGELEARLGTPRSNPDVSELFLIQNHSDIVNVYNHYFATLSTSPSHPRYAIVRLNRDFL